MPEAEPRRQAEHVNAPLRELIPPSQAQSSPSSPCQAIQAHRPCHVQTGTVQLIRPAEVHLQLAL